MSWLVIADADTGQRLAAAKDAIVAEEKAQEQERRGHRVAISEGPAVRERPSPRFRDDEIDRMLGGVGLIRASGDVPDGYRLLDPRPLAESTRKRDPARWRAEAREFPVEWGRWGHGHYTANVAYACLDRGLIQIAVPLKKGKPYLYRQKPEVAR